MLYILIGSLFLAGIKTLLEAISQYKGNPKQFRVWFMLFIVLLFAEVYIVYTNFISDKDSSERQTTIVAGVDTLKNDMRDIKESVKDNNEAVLDVLGHSPQKNPIFVDMKAKKFYAMHLVGIKGVATNIRDTFFCVRRDADTFQVLYAGCVDNPNKYEIYTPSKYGNWIYPLEMQYFNDGFPTTFFVTIFKYTNKEGEEQKPLYSIFWARLKLYYNVPLIPASDKTSDSIISFLKFHKAIY